MKNDNSRPWLSWLVLFAGAMLPALVLIDVVSAWAGTGAFLGKYSPKLAILMGGLILVELLGLAGLVLVSTPLWKKLLRGLDALADRLHRLGWLLPVLSAGLWLALPLAFFDRLSGLLLGGFYTRLFVVWGLALLQLLVWRAWRPSISPLAIFCGALLAYSAVFVGLFYLNGVAATPFMLGWSEASRYYNASLWFSRQVYGIWLPLPELHPSRYLLQSLAFLFSDSIEVHRAWQVFLSLACSGLTAWALARRFKSKDSPLTPISDFTTNSPALGRELGGGVAPLLIGLWAFVFFFQGPIYYHLILSAFFVLVGFDRNHFWRSLIVVVLASLWAGISRINWYPVPGVLAATLYLLEEPKGRRPLLRYLTAPAVWAAAGLAAAFAANLAYVAFSGNPPEVFGSALSSPLLWYRLKPNPTFGPGVLVGSLVLLPVCLAMAWGVLRTGRRWNFTRLLGLLTVLAVFYVSGVIVSLKVGGGGDLHNLDNFIVFEAVIAAYLACNRFAFERTEESVGQSIQNLRIPIGMLLGVMILPILFAARIVPMQVPEPAAKSDVQNAQAVAWLQKYIDEYAKPDHPVLFISARQLVTFGQVKVAAFEPKYEKVFLMEMAMSGNPQYLGSYLSDLKARKFSLIISEPMNAQVQENYGFAEENNLWVKNVELPTLVRYQKIAELKDFSLAIYAPK